MNTIKTAVAILSLTLAASAHAKFQSAMPQIDCSLQASSFTVNGEPLSYEKARSLPRATKVASMDLVQIAPVTLPNGREARVSIEPNGCAHVAQVLGIR